jgi:hypothetical protein
MLPCNCCQNNCLWYWPTSTSNCNKISSEVICYDKLHHIDTASFCFKS